ncbi:hypothetical protein [Mucilaginibacter flavidus]|uniref:hypothetical protein n=1 Tax=Mucilaginibacter flavidus TaxID=2949309 RepID=UPI00209396F5|nr:hypothetical protein [Mucilaginibacter flavidus]MCO5947033.1 hypothetical protein [Mucilaginibacter flavidus]
MKEEKTKSAAKAAHAAEKKTIKENLIKELRVFATKLGHTTKKIEKDIEKAAKQLAKKLAKPVKSEHVKATKVKAEASAVPVAKAQKLAAVDSKPAVAAPKAVKKETTTKAAPVKKATK